MTGMVCIMTNNEMTWMTKIIGMTGMIWMTGTTYMIGMNRITNNKMIGMTGITRLIGITWTWTILPDGGTPRNSWWDHWDDGSDKGDLDD